MCYIDVVHCFTKLVWNPVMILCVFCLRALRKEGNIQYLNNAGKRYLQYEANSSAMVADSFTD